MGDYTFTPEALNRFAVITQKPADEDPNESDVRHLSVIGWLTTDAGILPVVLDPTKWSGVTLVKWLEANPTYRLLRLRRGKTQVEVSGSVSAWSNSND